MTRENQRILLTKRLLKEAIIRLLQRKSLEKISVTELCIEAGINRATFYRHYTLPRDVLTDIEKELISAITDMRAIPRTQEEIRTFIRHACAYVDDHADMLRLIIRSNSDAELFALFHEVSLKGLHELLQTLPLSRPIDEESINLLATYGAGGSCSLLRQWLLGSIQKSAADIAELICDLLFSSDWMMLARQTGPNTP